MKDITKHLMSATLGVALLAGSLGFSSTIEASPHNNMVYMDDGDHRPPEPPERYHRHHRHHHGPQDDQRGPGLPPPPYDDQRGPELPPPPPPHDDQRGPELPPPPPDVW
jgi:hypothetical protein